MLTHTLSAAHVATVALVLAVAPAPPRVSGSGALPPTPPPSASAAPTADGYDVEVTSSSTVGGGTPFVRSVRVHVPAMCWMSAGPTGIEYARDWQPGGTQYEINANGGYPWEHLVYPNYMDHAASEGRWYTATCRTDAPPGYTLDYLNAHPTRFVEPTEPAPAADPAIDPQVLAHAARDAMVLPTGTIRWNPSLNGSDATLVNWDTFVWVEGATDAVQVRAEVVETGTWAQVDARMATLQLSAQNAADATCTSLGTPYSPGMQDSDCAIVFTRSTANLPVKSGQTLPTATLTATAVWEASWTSSLDATPQPLDIQDTTTTAEVPVAEVQTVVTR